MTGIVKVRWTGTGKIGQVNAENIPFRISALELAIISGLFVANAKKHDADYPNKILYEDNPLCLAENLLKTASIYLPRSTEYETGFHARNLVFSSLLLGAGGHSCSQYLNVIMPGG